MVVLSGNGTVRSESRRRLAIGLFSRTAYGQKIDSTEEGIVFYGRGIHNCVPLENLVPATNAAPGCWEVDSSR